jgi:hypothetical protein
VDTIHKQLRPPVLHVDIVTAEAMAIAAGTAAPPILRIHNPPQVGALAVAMAVDQAAILAHVGRALAPLFYTLLHKCNPSRQSARLLKE